MSSREVRRPHPVPAKEGGLIGGSVRPVPPLQDDADEAVLDLKSDVITVGAKRQDLRVVRDRRWRSAARQGDLVLPALRPIERERRHFRIGRSRPLGLGTCYSAKEERR